MYYSEQDRIKLNDAILEYEKHFRIILEKTRRDTSYENQKFSLKTLTTQTGPTYRSKHFFKRKGSVYRHSEKAIFFPKSRGFLIFAFP